MSEPQIRAIDHLQQIVSRIGLKETARRSTFNAGTISTWLLIPSREQRVAEINRLVFPSVIDLAERARLSRILRNKPSRVSQEIIQELYNEVFPPTPPPPVPTYRFIRFAWYLDLYNNKIQKYELHARITLSGTVNQELLDTKPDYVKEKLKKELSSAVNSTLFTITVQGGRNSGGIDDLLFLFFKKMERQGTYGDIETLNTALMYDEQWDFYAYFRNNKSTGENYEYVWQSKWRIGENTW